MKRIILFLLASSFAGAVLWGVAQEEPKTPAESATPAAETKTDEKTDPSKTEDHETIPLSDAVKNGMKWLVAQQLPSGGWSEGERVVQHGLRGQSSNAQRAEPWRKHATETEAKPSPKPPPPPASVADTCIATLALVRSGEHLTAVEKAIHYVCGEVERADAASMYITTRRGTRVQGKIGQYVDTFLAAQLLTEVKKSFSDKALNARVDTALSKVLAKMETNQKEDGTWSKTGWAANLSQSIAAKAVNGAVQRGVKVKEETRARVEVQAQQFLDRKTGTFRANEAAGIALYQASGCIIALQESDLANTAVWSPNEKIAKDETASSEDRKQAEANIIRFRENKKQLADNRKAVVAKLNDQRFIAGFGNNGGEEFLSYMNIAEALFKGGDETFKTFFESMHRNLTKVQNKDGSWTGHHCITGRTFCTASALMVMTTDRMAIPEKVTVEAPADVEK